MTGSTRSTTTRRRQYGDGASSGEAGQAAPATPSPEQLRADGRPGRTWSTCWSAWSWASGCVADEGPPGAGRGHAEQLRAEPRMPAEHRVREALRRVGRPAPALLGQSCRRPSSATSRCVAVYDALAKAGAIPAGLTVDEVRQAFGRRRRLRARRHRAQHGAQDEAEPERRHGQPPVPRRSACRRCVSTGQSPVFYSLPYVDQDGPVTDIVHPGAAPRRRRVGRAGDGRAEHDRHGSSCWSPRPGCRPGC